MGGSGTCGTSEGGHAGPPVYEKVSGDSGQLIGAMWLEAIGDCGAVVRSILQSDYVSFGH